MSTTGEPVPGASGPVPEAGPVQPTAPDGARPSVSPAARETLSAISAAIGPTVDSPAEADAGLRTLAGVEIPPPDPIEEEPLEVDGAYEKLSDDVTTEPDTEPSTKGATTSTVDTPESPGAPEPVDDTEEEATPEKISTETSVPVAVGSEPLYPFVASVQEEIADSGSSNPDEVRRLKAKLAQAQARQAMYEMNQQIYMLQQTAEGDEIGTALLAELMVKREEMRKQAIEALKIRAKAENKDFGNLLADEADEAKTYSKRSKQQLDDALTKGNKAEIARATLRHEAAKEQASFYKKEKRKNTLWSLAKTLGIGVIIMAVGNTFKQIRGGFQQGPRGQAR